MMPAMAELWPSILEDPANWRHLARQARSDAERCASPLNKATMLRIADRYDLLAERAERMRAEKISAVAKVPN